jgi:1-deoxy-D-xylulose-5-phosphate reductoisomerase
VAKKRIALFGATGSIGTQTLDVVRQFPERFEVAGLSARSSAEKLRQAGREFACDNLTLAAESGEEGLRAMLKKSRADVAVNGVAGAAGLLPSVLALEAGVSLALANKETLVMAGHFVKELARTRGCLLLPVDSEHSALFRLINQCGRENVESVILTASGGPFRTLPAERFESLSAADALKHPTWRMGRKITVDSATLANKGLEVIEACCLFDLPPEKVQVVIHPQSVVHSLVRTRDGVLYAQISPPDMRLPILAALLYPECAENRLPQLDLTSSVEMGFYPPRFDDFPMLRLAYRAAERGQGACVAYNVANEEAAAAFLAGKSRFTDFAPVAERVLEETAGKEPASLGDVLALDAEARSRAREALAGLAAATRALPRVSN